MTDIHNPMRVQFHNLWGRHTAGISLFGKWSPLLHFLLVSHSLGVSLTRIPIHHFSPLSPLPFLIFSRRFDFFPLPSSVSVPLRPLPVAAWLVIMSQSSCMCCWCASRSRTCGVSGSCLCTEKHLFHNWTEHSLLAQSLMGTAKERLWQIAIWVEETLLWTSSVVVYLRLWSGDKETQPPPQIYYEFSIHWLELSSRQEIGFSS